MKQAANMTRYRIIDYSGYQAGSFLGKQTLTATELSLCLWLSGFSATYQRGSNLTMQLMQSACRRQGLAATKCRATVHSTARRRSRRAEIDRCSGPKLLTSAQIA
jgi:hypothetical protein